MGAASRTDGPYDTLPCLVSVFDHAAVYGPARLNFEPAGDERMNLDVVDLVSTLDFGGNVSNSM